MVPHIFFSNKANKITSLKNARIINMSMLLFISSLSLYAIQAKHSFHRTL